MYQITCDGYILYDTRDDNLVVDGPRVDLEVNTVGGLSFTIYKTHPYYDKLKKMRSVFEVSDEIGVIFRGRMTNDTADFYNSKDVDVEGAMAYLNDSTVRPYDFPGDFLTDPAYIQAAASGNVVAFFLGWLIEQHNGQVEEFQRLRLGNVTVSDPNNYITRSNTGYSTTWEEIKAKLFDSSLGGYLCIRYEKDGNYIDYLSEFELTNTQEITFGENLLDIINESDASETYSAIVPIGAKITEETEGHDGESSTTEKVLTIAGLPDGPITDDIVKNGDTIYSKSAVEAYGWICAPVEDTTWDDVTEAQNLQTKGVQFLASDGVKLSDTVEVTAVDLHFTDAQIRSLRIYRNVVVNSKIHGHKKSLFPLSKLSIYLDSPQDTKITVGSTRRTLTDINGEKESDTIHKIERVENDLREQVGSQTTIIKDLQGNVLTQAVTEYYQSTSPTELSGGSWSETAPAWKDGWYMWSRTRTTRADGSTSYSAPTCISGATGQPGKPGEDGEPGTPGKDGVGVSSVDVQYYLSTSPTTLSGGSWSTTAPTWSDGKYMWSKTVTTLTNGGVEESKPVCITGGKGSTGAAGTTITSITEEYYLSTSKDTQTGGSWVTTPPAWSKGMYMWTRSKIVYANPAKTEYTTPVCDSSWEAANDVQADLDSTKDNLVERIETSYTQVLSESERIILAALQSYVETSNFEEFRQTVQSQLEILADSIEISFTTATEHITDVDGDLQNKFTELYKYIRFSGENAITIGSGDSAITLEIDNVNGISFKRNGVQFGHWDGENFYTGNIVVEVNERAQFGNFAFVPRSDGSLSFLKVGG